MNLSIRTRVSCGRLLKTALCGLSLTVVTGTGTAQEKEARAEYRASVKSYINSLDESFAYRYLDNEVMILDLMSTTREEFWYRRDKKITILPGTEGLPFARKEMRDSIRLRMNTIKENLEGMKKSNRVLPGYTDQKALNELHMEYQRLYAMDLGMTKIDAMAIRSRLVKSGTPDDIRRMVQHHLKIALRRYKEESYSAAAAELQDIYETYNTVLNEWDDVVYYIGDSYYRMKDFDNAKTWFDKLVSEMTTSPYVERALYTQITMAYIKEDRSAMQKYYGEYLAKAPERPKDDNRYNRAFYLAGLTFFSTSDYTTGIAALRKVSKESRYYWPARYLVAHCYVGLEQYNEALEEFVHVTKIEPNNPRFTVEDQKRLKDLSLLKASFIKFEQTINGQKFNAVFPYMKKIQRSSEYHDAALLIASWASFKDNDIDTARIFADSLVNLYPASDYLFETKTLLGNIKVLDPTLTDRDRELYAVESYNFVAEATEAKYLADQFIAERDSTRKTLMMLEDAKRVARIKNDSASFMRYDELHRQLSDALENNGYNRIREGKSAGFYQTMSVMASKIRVTEAKLREARESGNKEDEEKFGKQLSDQISDFQQIGAENYLEKNRIDASEGSTDQLAALEIETYFQKHKISRTISEMEARNRQQSVLREKIGREKQLVQNQLFQIDDLMKTARERNNQSAMLKLDFERNKLAGLYYRLSDYEVLLLADAPAESYVDLDTWGDFASYGRNNINFVLNSTKSEQIGDIGKAVAQIDKILETRKRNYELRIAEVEREIELKEREIRDKELQEMRREQQTFFQKEYFLDKSSEKPENDPFDYNDVVPEVIVIDTKPIEAPQEQQQEEGAGDEELPPSETVQGDSTVKSTPADSASSTSAPGTQTKEENATADSTSGDGSNGESALLINNEAAQGVQPTFILRNQVADVAGKPRNAFVFIRRDEKSIQSKKIFKS